MVVPFHQYATVALASDAGEIADALRSDPQGLVAAATADALAALGTPAGTWGLSATALPEVQARRTDPDELGCLELEWCGNEDATAWPSLAGRLLVVPQPTAGCELLLVSTRSPQAELATRRLDRLHRRRVVDVAAQRFLRDLAGRIGAGSAPSTPSGPGSVERTPMFVHHLRAVAGDPQRIAHRLRANAADLADHATRAAVARSAAPLAAGRFRVAAAPRVDAHLATPGSLGVVRITWHAQEEASGWPELDLAIVIEAHAQRQARIAALSARPPGYDLSRNQSDKHQRDHLLRHAAAHLLEALCEQVEDREPTPARDDPAGRLLGARS